MDKYGTPRSYFLQHRDGYLQKIFPGIPDRITIPDFLLLLMYGWYSRLPK